MSVVQAFASELLMVHEDRRRADDADWTFKAQLAGGNPEMIKRFFTESDDGDASDVDRVVEKGEWQHVQWLSPSDHGIEEYDAVMEQVRSLTSLKIGANEGGWV